MTGHVSNAIDTARALAATIEASNELRARDIDPILVGGRLLVAEVRGGIPKRTLDAELLVPRRRLDEAQRVLISSGWNERPSSGRPRTLEVNDARIRLQRRLFVGHVPTPAERRLVCIVVQNAEPDRFSLRRVDPPTRLVILACRELLAPRRPPIVADLVAAIDALEPSQLKAAHTLAAKVGAARALEYVSALHGAGDDRSPTPEAPRTPFDSVLLTALEQSASSLADVPTWASWAVGRGVARSVSVADLELSVVPGVYRSGSAAAALADSVLSCVDLHGSGTIVDVGTGSGAVAILIARRLPRYCVIATDISAVAVATARWNVHHLGARNVEVRRGSLLDPMRGQPAIAVVANLPFVSGANAPVVEYQSGVFGPGLDGLDLVRRLLVQGRDVVVPGGWMIFRSDKAQHETITAFAAGAGFQLDRIEGRTVITRRVVAS